MTVPSTPGHLDLDALADVLAGERSGERHLRACAACEERLAELAAAEVAVAAQLATLPSPPLPDGLADRLAAALRAEAAAGSPPPAPGASSPTGERSAATVSPLRPRRRAPSWLPAAAAAVALVLAGGFGLNALLGVGQGGGAESAAGGGSAGADAAGTESADVLTSESRATGADYADEDARTDAVAALLDGAAPPVPPAPARSSTAATAADGAAPALVGPGADPVLTRLRDPAALQECLDALRRDGSPAAAPLAIDHAAFDGAPALAVVQPDDDPSRLVLTVAGPGCSGADPDRLLRTRLARP